MKGRGQVLPPSSPSSLACITDMKEEVFVSLKEICWLAELKGHERETKEQHNNTTFTTHNTNKMRSKTKWQRKDIHWLPGLKGRERKKTGQYNNNTDAATTQRKGDREENKMAIHYLRC